MYVPTRILFGVGQLANLHTQFLPGKKALLLTSNRTSAKTSGAFDKTVEQLEKAIYRVAGINE